MGSHLMRNPGTPRTHSSANRLVDQAIREIRLTETDSRSMIASEWVPSRNLSRISGWRGEGVSFLECSSFSLILGIVVNNYFGSRSSFPGLTRSRNQVLRFLGGSGIFLSFGNILRKNT